MASGGSRLAVFQATAGAFTGKVCTSSGLDSLLVCVYTVDSVLGCDVKLC